MTQKELAQMTIDAIDNPQNIYHVECKYAVGILAGWFNLSYEQCLDKIKEYAK